MRTIKYTSALVLLYFYITCIFWFILFSGRCVCVSTFNHCAEYIFQWCCCHLQNESSDEQPLSLKIKGTNAALKKQTKKPPCFLHRATPLPSSTPLCRNTRITIWFNTEKRILQNKSLLRGAFSILSSIPLREIHARACRQPHGRALHLPSGGGTTPLPERSRWVTALSRPCLPPAPPGLSL